ncbi:flavodoxin family protein [Methanoculleus sp. FWC-SCC1]|uniref:Flavodoxin family protein n=1 Tax=Methanoculleus frigidifontis TaxID=2584085 RepID=A0ABT8M6Z1_9EURY|nr:flavodoxin family protein [Methanoculleus sp. FWC-SCC1]MDN7023659.1 flavodoxin family protein [Methanoculleus sp. FWC-SCC1]
MKVLVVMGSPRKGNTYRAAERIREAMQSSASPVVFEYLMLKDADLAQCLGCFLCFEKGEERCPHRDDAAAIEAKMHEADGVIFASPVYGMNVSGLMKVFIDRLSYIFHRPRFFDKHALLLVTTGALGEKDVLDYLNLVAGIWGFSVAARVGIVTSPVIAARQARKNEQKLEKAAQAFAGALARKARPSPGLRDVIVFHGQRGTFAELREHAPVDYAYWKDMGWLEPGRRYFVDVPINPVYDVIGRVVEWQARRQVRRSLAEAG